jgi:3-oxoacyl-[acyl-carrier protein] reductase
MIGPDPLDLRGQIAFVTGAGRGVGRAIALTLACHNVGGIAINDYVAERASSVVSEIAALGVRAIAVAGDVADYASVRAAFDSAAAMLGPVTLLVNNAVTWRCRAWSLSAPDGL